MRYLPHTSEDIAAMLEAIGVKSLDDLFPTVPVDCRRKGDLNLPDVMTEWELDKHIDALSGSMAASPEYNVFIGAGS
jgi:glycine dehydrogenase subunit 1